MELQAPVGAGHKTTILGVRKQGEFTPVCPGSQVGGKASIGTRVIDHDEFEITATGPHRINGCECRCPVAIHRHDHIDGAWRPLAGPTLCDNVEELLVDGGERGVAPGGSAGFSKLMEGCMALDGQANQGCVGSSLARPPIEERWIDEPFDPPLRSRRQGIGAPHQRPDRLGGGEWIAGELLDRQMNDCPAAVVAARFKHMEEPECDCLLERHRVAGSQRRSNVQWMPEDVDRSELVCQSSRGPFPEWPEAAEPRILDAPDGSSGEFTAEDGLGLLAIGRYLRLLEPVVRQRRRHCPGER